LVFFLFTVAESILTTWIFNHTRGSALLAGIFHAASDYTIIISGVATNDLGLFWLFIVIQWIFTLAIVFVDRREWFGVEKKMLEAAFRPNQKQKNPSVN
jgi:hypothetical protein